MAGPPWPKLAGRRLPVKLGAGTRVFDPLRRDETGQLETELAWHRDEQNPRAFSRQLRPKTLTLPCAGARIGGPRINKLTPALLLTAGGPAQEVKLPCMTRVSLLARGSSWTAGHG